MKAGYIALCSIIVALLVFLIPYASYKLYVYLLKKKTDAYRTIRDPAHLPSSNPTDTSGSISSSSPIRQIALSRSVSTSPHCELVASTNNNTTYQNDNYIYPLSTTAIDDSEINQQTSDEPIHVPTPSNPFISPIPLPTLTS